MQTTRIGGIVTSSPNTQWWMGADWISQDAANNRSLLRVSLTCANGPSGSTGSFTNSSGTQYTWWGGGELLRHNFPNLPSGYAQNQTRWDDWGDIWFGHDGNGNLGQVDFGMHVNYGSTSGDWYGSIPGPARIPKPPSAPGGPSVSGIGPKSATIAFTQPGDNRGSAIDQFQVLISKNPNPEISPVYSATGITSSPVTVNTLDPATDYYTKVRAHNGSYGGWGDWSATAQFRTLSGAYVGKSGAFPGAEMLVGKAGSFQTVLEVRVGKGGSFVLAG
jgi:hypothetical protein